MLALPSLVTALALLVPLMAAIALSDLRRLRIPNRMVLLVFGVFLVTGAPLGLAGLDWGLPGDVFLWRIGYAVAVLAGAFLLYSVASAKVGGGDLKLIAAMAPFLSGDSLGGFLLIYVVVSLAGLVLHRLIRAGLRGRETGWKALDQSVYFPAGLLLGVALLVQLGFRLWARLETGA